ncbi:hypothetical protein CCHR01_18787 [Colletotrichum chrysophilum]|uniref:Uncharacterized protein n=1 Tax=Colletotrichum chrysophilum TaxID=1836956 RepID=A0AAD9E8J7_9PEZI|nr:hypothetical protein CCHR01_18787 [Colletotrichum chrysophilum]
MRRQPAQSQLQTCLLRATSTTISRPPTTSTAAGPIIARHIPSITMIFDHFLFSGVRPLAQTIRCTISDQSTPIAVGVGSGSGSGSGSGAAPEVAPPLPSSVRRLSSPVHRFRLPSPPLIWKACMVWSLLSAIARFSAHRRVGLLETRCLSRGHLGILPVVLGSCCFCCWLAKLTSEHCSPEPIFSHHVRSASNPLIIPARQGKRFQFFDASLQVPNKVPNRLAWKLELELDLELLRLTPSSTWSRGSSLCR